jgi:hypothetical protein
MKSYEFQITNYELRIVKILCVLCVLCGAVFSANAQSTNQSYPTAITSNEISGRIAARDIGDARLTGYFYAFNGGQGDIFINIQTSNFNGDIDIFTAGSLKPLTKITIYADDTGSETGRVMRRGCRRKKFRRGNRTAIICSSQRRRLAFDNGKMGIGERHAFSKHRANRFGSQTFNRSETSRHA